jgi:hypothetical protein
MPSDINHQPNTADRFYVCDLCFVNLGKVSLTAMLYTLNQIERVKDKRYEIVLVVKAAVVFAISRPACDYGKHKDLFERTFIALSYGSSL